MKRALQTARAATSGNPAYGMLHTAISEALKYLKAPPPISDESIHDARKSLKKARAALRLLQDGMSKHTYETENSRLRDAGRFLSPFRDARSLIDAFDSLHDRYDDKLQGVNLAPLQKILHANLTKARRHFLHTPTELKNCIRLLKDCITLAKKEEFSSIDFEAVETGLRRVYRKGLKARAEAEAARTPEALHEWRKQVKYLLNAVEDLHPSEKGSVVKILKWIDQLADCLGNDHDLAMLSQEIARGTYASVDSEVIKTLHGLIDRRRTKLQKKAFSLGEKLYDWKPKRFTQRMLKQISPASPTAAAPSVIKSSPTNDRQQKTGG
jgi:CHAD domain-containing protein